MDVCFRSLIVAFILCSATPSFATEIGKVKILSGEVTIQRDGSDVAAILNEPLYAADNIVTGQDGLIGMLFNDDTRASAGPNSNIKLDKFSYNNESHDGSFDMSIQKGSLSIVAGKITHKTPGAFKLRTPTATLGVRGTEFSVMIEP